MEEQRYVGIKEDGDNKYSQSTEQRYIGIGRDEIRDKEEEEQLKLEHDFSVEAMSNWDRAWSADNPNLSAAAHLATDHLPLGIGKWFWSDPVEEETEFSENVKGSWEGKFAVKNPTLAATLKTGASFIVPGETFLIPSSKEDFGKMSTGMKAAILGIEVFSLASLGAALTPATLAVRGFILKSAKSVVKRIATTTAMKKADNVIKPAIKAMARDNPKIAAAAIKVIEKRKASILKKQAERSVNFKEVDPYAHKLMRDIPEFTYVKPVDRAAKAFNLTKVDAERLLKGENDAWVTTNKRSGAAGFKKNALSDIRNSKTYKKKSKEWDIPQGVQRQMHYSKHLGKQLNKVLTGTKIKPDTAFSKIAYDIYGEDAIGLTMKNAPTDMVANVLLNTIKREHGVLKGIDIGKISWFRASRKVFAKYNKTYKVKDKVYGRFGKLVENSNKSSFMNITSWHAILQGKGLGKINTKGGSYKFKELYRKKDLDEAGKLVTDIDTMTAKGRPQEAMNELFEGKSHTVQKLAKSWVEWSDLMYGEHMKGKITHAFDTIGLTEKGKIGFQASMNGAEGINRYIDEAMSSVSNLSQSGKKDFVEKILGLVIKGLDDGKLNWFTDKSMKDLSKKELYQIRNKAKKLKNSLTIRANGGDFMDYTENYGLRIGKNPVIRESMEGVPGKMTSGYTKARMNEEFAGERVTNLADLVNIRSRMQAKELNINPYMKDVQESIKDLPPELKKYSEHYIQRMLGMTSDTDNTVAAIIRKQFGLAISGERITRVAQTMNNLVYMGALGLKPFSAMRNLFQPLMMVPTDMGGVKDIYWLAKGYQRAFSEEGVKYVRSIGAIQDFAPDLIFMNKASKLGETIKIGKHTFDAPTMQGIQDTCLYIYKSSDVSNRMVTGSAAAAKWDHYISKYTVNGVLDKKRFLKKMKIHQRAADSTEKITKMVMKGSEEIGHGGTRNLLKDAKAVFCNDVIADTQYLYNTANSPLISSSKGALTKTGFLFQSWWMNYGEAFAKWSTRTKGTPEKLEKLFTFMLTSAMAYNGMRLLWDERTASRTVLTGPLPLSPSLPATWRPAVDAVRLVTASAQAVTGMGDINDAKRQFKRLAFGSLPVFAPGGIQAMQTIRRTGDEGMPGFLKSIIKYKRD